MDAAPAPDTVPRAAQWRLWLSQYTARDIEQAILQTACKFCNEGAGPERMTAEATGRYTSAVLRNWQNEGLEMEPKTKDELRALMHPTTKDELLAHYGRKEPHRFYQYDGFVLDGRDDMIHQDEDGYGVMYGETFELMGGSSAVRVLILPDTSQEDVLALLLKIATQIGRSGAFPPGVAGPARYQWVAHRRAENYAPWEGSQANWGPFDLDESELPF